MTVYKYFIFENVTLEIYSRMSTLVGTGGCTRVCTPFSPVLPLSPGWRHPNVTLSCSTSECIFLTLWHESRVPLGGVCYVTVSFEIGILCPV